MHSTWQRRRVLTRTRVVLVVVCVLGGLIATVSSAPPAAADPPACPYLYSGSYTGEIGSAGGTVLSASAEFDITSSTISGSITVVGVTAPMSVIGTVDCDALLVSLDGGAPLEGSLGVDSPIGGVGPFVEAHGALGFIFRYQCDVPPDGQWSGPIAGVANVANLAFAGDLVSGELGPVAAVGEPVSGEVFCNAGTLEFTLPTSGGDLIGSFLNQNTMYGTATVGPWSLRAGPPVDGTGCPYRYSGSYTGEIGSLGGAPFPATGEFRYVGDVVIGSVNDPLGNQTQLSGTIECERLILASPVGQQFVGSIGVDPPIGGSGPFVEANDGNVGWALEYDCAIPPDGHWIGRIGIDALEAELTFRGDDVSGTVVVPGASVWEPVAGAVYCDQGLLQITLQTSYGALSGSFSGDVLAMTGTWAFGTWELRRSPVDVRAGHEISAGGVHTCWAMSESPAVCAGANGFGQLGDGTTSDNANLTSLAPSIQNFTSITAGLEHSCGVATNALVYCWGGGQDGQLGNGDDLDRVAPAQVSRTDLSLAQVSAGAHHTCGLTFTGRAMCWGANDRGQLGDGTMRKRTIPTSVALPTGLRLISISAGDDHTCGLSSTGVVYCWGANTSGQVGVGDLVDRPSPEAVNGQLEGRVITDVSAGGFHTCATTEQQEVFCWGANHRGQLGSDELLDRTEPLEPVGILATSVEVGGNHTCVLDPNGQAWCWGANGRGQIGVPPDEDQPFPKVVSEELTFAAISAGGEHTCALSTGGGLYCWGGNGSGQLAVGDFDDRETPTTLERDTTPPSVIPTVDPAVGPSGWHTTDVTVTWAVSDPESAITTPECGPTVVNVDTTGQNVPCTATSAGGSNPRSVTVRRDATAPVVAVTGVTAGATYPATAVPFPACTTTDATSGVATSATVTGVVYTGSSGTTYNYSARCGGAVDRAGNAAPTVAVTYSVTNPGGRPGEFASGTVPPGGTVTTDVSGTGPDATDGLDTTVTSPNGGVVTISEQPAVAPPPVGYATLGMQVQITAPPASADDPLRIVFDIDASMITPPDTKDTIAIIRNGQPLTNCLGASQVPANIITAGGVACVAGRDNVPVGGSDVRITVITTTASLWQLAVPTGPTINLGRGSVAEGTTGLDRKIFVPVTLSEPSKTTVVVNYQVQKTGAAGSATAGSDFVAAQGKVTFKPTTTGNTATTKWVAVRVKPDDRAEVTEDIRIVVTGVTGGGYTLNPTPGIATILDDDTTPGALGVSIGGGAISEGDHAYPKYNVAKLTLALSHPASVDTTVTLEISGGSATSNIDYKAWNNKIPQRKTITFKPGQFQKPIAMNVLADLVADPGEFVTVKIISVTGNTSVLHSLATLTITDDD